MRLLGNLAGGMLYPGVLYGQHACYALGAVLSELALRGLPELPSLLCILQLSSSRGLIWGLASLRVIAEAHCWTRALCSICVHCTARQDRCRTSPQLRQAQRSLTALQLHSCHRAVLLTQVVTCTRLVVLREVSTPMVLYLGILIAVQGTDLAQDHVHKLAGCSPATCWLQITHGTAARAARFRVLGPGFSI